MTGYLYRGDPWLEEANSRIMEDRKASASVSNGGMPAKYAAKGHGTAARARKHRRAGETPCTACLEAENAARRALANPEGRTLSEAQRARRSREREEKLTR